MPALVAAIGCVLMTDDDDVRQRSDPPTRSMLNFEASTEITPASQLREHASRPRTLKGHALRRALDRSRKDVTDASAEMIASGWGEWSGWAQWCETAESRSCSVDEECGTGYRCVRPWWAKGRRDQDQRMCVRAWPSMAERSWRRNRLRTIVDLTCSRRDGCERRQLHEFLSIVALRESTWRPYKRHRLNGDVVAARAARDRRRRVYRDNAHYDDIERWSSALGLYGQNPAIFVDAWDRRAPPEILCREVEATAAYLERARRAVRGFRRRGIDPTLCDVHHAVSAGRLEPCKGDGGTFARRARRSGIDPDAHVDEASMGQGPPKDTAARLAWADALRSAVEAEHPAP